MAFLLRSLLTLCLLATTYLTIAQPYINDWKDTGINGIISDESWVHAACQTPDGAIQLVGSYRSPSKDLDSYIATLDPKNNGSVSLRRFLRDGSKSLDDELLSITQGAIGTLWLGGYASSSSNAADVYPRLIHLDHEFKTINTFTFREYPGYKFTHLTALQDGSLLLCAEAPAFSRKTKPIFFFHFINNQLNELRELEDIRYQFHDIVAILSDQNRTSHYIIANGLGKRNTNNYTVSVIQLNDDLARQNVKSTEKEGTYIAQAASIAPGGKLLITGYSLPYEKSDSDVWITAFNPDTGQLEALHSGNDVGYDDQGKGIVRAPGGFYVIPQLSSETVIGAQKEQYSLVRGSEQLDVQEIQVEVPFIDNASRLLTLMTYDGRLVLIGNTPNGSKYVEPNLSAYAPADLLQSKGNEAIQLRCSDIKLVFGNGDNTFSPGENLELQFDITNISSDASIWGMQIKTGGNLLAGMTTQAIMGVSALVKNKPATQHIPVFISKNVALGQSTFQIQVMKDGRTFCQLEKTIQSSSESAGKLTISPGISRSDDGVYPSQEQRMLIPMQIFSDAPIEREHVQIKQEGVLLQGSKNASRITYKQLSNGRIENQLELQVELQAGENEITFTFTLPNGATQTETFIILYKPEKKRVNLHVLAIGPDYSDFSSKGYKSLYYNHNDVLQFTYFMKQQEVLGMYNHVFTRTLITKDTTKRQPIEIAFNDLLNRTTDISQHNYIAKDDVVVVFFSGHGDMIGDEFCLIPSDFNPKTDVATVVNYKDMLNKYMKKLNRKTLLFMDACHSGDASSKGTGTVDSLLSTQLNRLHTALPGILAFQSCSSGENSWECGNEIKNGFFSEALFEAFSAKNISLAAGAENLCADDNSDQLLTLKELIDFTGYRVPLLMQSQGYNQQQHPSVSDFSSKKAIDLSINYFKVVPGN